MHNDTLLNHISSDEESLKYQLFGYKFVLESKSTNQLYFIDNLYYMSLKADFDTYTKSIGNINDCSSSGHNSIADKSILSPSMMYK